MVAQQVDESRLVSELNPQPANETSAQSVAVDMIGMGMELGAAARGQLHVAPADDASIDATLSHVLSKGVEERVRCSAAFSTSPPAARCTCTIATRSACPMPCGTHD